MQRRQFLTAATSAATALLSAGCEPAPRALQGGFAGIDLERGHQVRDLLARGALPAPGLVRRAQVVIAGGGVAGLAAARALRLAGVNDFVLLELEDQAGGNSRGSAVNGVPCPMGAHYLPVPGDDAREVQDLLEELGLRQRVAGRWQYDERHLCHSPQERLYFQGQWHEGLLPVQGVPPSTLAQYQRFARQVQTLMQSARFAMPMLKTLGAKKASSAHSSSAGCYYF
jgi:monoamine oxidase